MAYSKLEEIDISKLGLETANQSVQRRADVKQLLFFIGITWEKLDVSILLTLADWLTIYYPDYTYEEWLKSPLLINWWYNVWLQHDSQLLIKNLHQHPRHKRLTVYRICHQWMFDEGDDRMPMIHADFRKLIPKFISEMKAADKKEGKK